MNVVSGCIHQDYDMLSELWRYVYLHVRAVESNKTAVEEGDGENTMPLVIRMDKLMRKHGLSLNELSRLVGITPPNLSRLKVGRSKSIRLATLVLLCEHLHCQPGDLIVFKKAEDLTDDDVVCTLGAPRTRKKS